MKIPPQCYRYPDTDVMQGFLHEQETVTPITKLEWKKGIFLYMEGAEYPQKSPADMETMRILNIVKRYFLETIRLYSKWFFFPTYFVLIFLPWSLKKRFMSGLLNSFTSVAWKPFAQYILKNEYLSSMGKEMEWGVYLFLDYLRIDSEISNKFAELFTSMIEYDNAYRYRVEDIMSETTKERLIKRPVREILRLSRVMQGRDTVHVAKKIRLFSYIAVILLLYPKFRRAFRYAVLEMNISNMGLDEIEKYWVCLRHDYKFMGKTDEERTEMIKDKKKPLLVPVKK